MDFAGRDLNPLEWACTAACEVCWSPDSREYDAEADCHDDLFACNSCEKHYHAECIGQRGWRPQTAQWQCPLQLGKARLQNGWRGQVEDDNGRSYPGIDPL